MIKCLDSKAKIQKYQLQMTSREAAVGVLFNLNVRLHERNVGGEMEFDVLDGNAALHPLALIIRLDFKNIIGNSRIIKVVGVDIDFQLVELHQQMRVGVEERAVGLEIDDSIGLENIPIIIKEAGGSEALIDVAHLRVGESNPNLVNLRRREETVDKFDAGAEEGHVGEILLESLLGACPHTRTLDVNADEVPAGETLGEAYSIFALAAAKLDDDGIGIVEIIAVPLATERKFRSIDDGKRILEHIFHCAHLSEFF
jgi:hypothetical protein